MQKTTIFRTFQEISLDACHFYSKCQSPATGSKHLKHEPLSEPSWEVWRMRSCTGSYCLLGTCQCTSPPILLHPHIPPILLSSHSTSSTFSILTPLPLSLRQKFNFCQMKVSTSQVKTHTTPIQSVSRFNAYVCLTAKD